jgi:CheY-like chemotaxis protein
MLTKCGCEVVWAQDGQKGLEAFTASEPYHFDAVLMDIRMPNMDGIEATKCIRKLERADAGTIPIIAMSANAYSDDVEACYAAGMSGHIPKPIDKQLMYRTIASGLQKEQ